MKNLRVLSLVFVGLVTFASFPQSSSATDGFHSAVKVSKELLKDGRLHMTFKLVPSENMVINMDGPWKLEVKKADGLEFSNNKLLKAEMQQSIPGFVAETKTAPKAKSGKIDYQMIAFVCSKDKSQCFRDVHNETFNW